ncbi:hypothetical protein [Marinifilum caeruleilacunae]|uniref:Helix-turn-helix domain-containing protein n=1 Tax=Marinifilum caeruleilacunae TaxID=2499076 RepID=A0ABX1X2I3_9BACT|nr:hypothetical protein [Marinifilum caeruleilacunae]NOU62299.1 hypothetical protein [Marinifilum caeruleilacunae]
MMYLVCHGKKWKFPPRKQFSIDWAEEGRDVFAVNNSTGQPQEFAIRLGISERHVYRLIACLKDEGIPIKFSRFSNSYLIE